MFKNDHSLENKFFSTHLRPMLRSSQFSDEKFYLPENKSEKLKTLLGSINAINQTWVNDSDKFVLKTLHESIIYVISQIIQTLNEMSLKDKIDLMEFNYFFLELKVLLKNYKTHYTEMSTAPLIPIHKLLFALAEKPANTDPTRLFFPYIKNFLEVWTNANFLSNTVLADTFQALGQLATQKQLVGGHTSLNFLIIKFQNNLENKSGENNPSRDIIYLLEGLQNLGGKKLLTVISIDSINQLLSKIDPDRLNSNMLEKFFFVYADLFDKWLIDTPDVIRYKTFEKIVFAAIPKAQDFQLANIARNLFRVLNSVSSTIKPDFSVLVKFLTTLEDLDKAAGQINNPDHWASRARNIGTTILFVGQIIKIRLFLSKKVNQIEPIIVHLFGRLEALFDNFIVVYEKVVFPDRARIEAQYLKIVDAVVSALQGSSLIGISKPCPACQRLAEAMTAHLQDNPKKFEKNYIKLIRYFSEYEYLTHPAGEFPGWLSVILEDNKPKPPEEHSVHAKTLDLFKKEGSDAEPEVLFGYRPIDIYHNLKGNIEINGKHHFRLEKQSDDLRKAYVIKFKEGEDTYYYDLSTPNRIVKSVNEIKLTQEAKLPSDDRQLYEFIGDAFPESEDFWVRDSKKIAAGLAKTPTVHPLTEPELTEPGFSLLGPDFKDNETEFKPKSKETSVDYSFKELINAAQEGDLSKVRKLLENGDLVNPRTKKIDPYTRIAALLTAMQQAQQVTEPSKRSALQSVVQDLIKRTSWTDLTTERSGLSPFILAMKWYDTNPEFYRWIENQFSTSKSATRFFDKAEAVENALKAEEALMVVPSLHYKNLVDIMNSTPKESKSAPKNEQTTEFDKILGKQAFCISREVMRRRAKEDKELAQLASALENFSKSPKDKVSVELLISQLKQLVEKRKHLEAITLLWEFYLEKKDYKMAIPFLQKACKQEDAEAHAQLGFLHMEGKGTKKNFSEARFYFSISAAQGNCYGQFGLALMYENGNGFAKNIEEAIRFYKLSAEQGYLSSQLWLARFYEQTATKSKRDAEFFRYYAQLAADQGNGYYQLFLGLHYLTNLEPDREKASHYLKLREAQSQTCPKEIYSEFLSLVSQKPASIEQQLENLKGLPKKEMIKKALELGKIYSPRFPDALMNSQKNYNHAALFFKLAAAAGDAEAQYYLAEAFYTGLGVEKNVQEAAQLCIKSSQQGNLYSKYLLGILYLKGKGVEKDAKKAFPLLKKAAETVPPAKYNLAVMYARGTGTKKDPKKAFHYFNLALKNGQLDAQGGLGELYLHGWGVKKNIPEAKRLFELENSRGDAYGQYQLAMLYKTGNGVAQNFKEAIRLLQCASKQDFTNASFELGTMFERGEFFAKNLNHAMGYYRKAAKLQHKLSLKRLESIESGIKASCRSELLQIDSDSDSDYSQELEQLATMMSETMINRMTVIPAMTYTIFCGCNVFNSIDIVGIMINNLLIIIDNLDHLKITPKDLKNIQAICGPSEIKHLEWPEKKGDLFEKRYLKSLLIAVNSPNFFKLNLLTDRIISHQRTCHLRTF